VFLKTKNANLAKFLEDQAFSSTRNLSRISQTIKDAIPLVDLLKEGCILGLIASALFKMIRTRFKDN
jgi:hypothetical protein